MKTLWKLLVGLCKLPFVALGMVFVLLINTGDMIISNLDCLFPKVGMAAALAWFVIWCVAPLKVTTTDIIIMRNICIMVGIFTFFVFFFVNRLINDRYGRLF